MPNLIAEKKHPIRRIVGKSLQFLFVVSAAYNFAHIRWCIANLVSEHWIRAWSTPLTGILHLNIGLGKRLARDVYVIFYILCFIPSTIGMANAFAAGFHRGASPTTWVMYLGAGVGNMFILLFMFWCLYGWPMRDVFADRAKEEDVQQSHPATTSETARCAVSEEADA
jgi:hypothetical protein